MNVSRKKAVLALMVLCALPAATWMGYSQLGRSHSPTSAQLVHELRTTLPLPYRWVNARLDAPTPPHFPRLLVATVVEAETRLSQRRRTAAERLASMGTNAWTVVPALIDALDDRNSSVVWAAASVLPRIRVDEYPEWGHLEKRLTGRGRPVPVLRYLLTGRDEFFHAFGLAHRRFALIGLAATGPAAGPTIPDVVNVLKSKEDYDLWAAAMRTLKRIGGDVPEVVSFHKRVMEDGEAPPNIRASALRALAVTAPEHPEAQGILRGALQDEKAQVRLTAASELWRLAAPPQEVLPSLTALLSHKLVAIRVGALNAISEMGGAALPTKPHVARLTTDDNGLVRQAAETALKRISIQTNTSSAPANPPTHQTGASGSTEPQQPLTPTVGSRSRSDRWPKGVSTCP